jgi:hypothetical protein
MMTVTVIILVVANDFLHHVKPQRTLHNWQRNRARDHCRALAPAALSGTRRILHPCGSVYVIIRADWMTEGVVIGHLPPRIPSQG